MATIGTQFPATTNSSNLGSTNSSANSSTQNPSGADPLANQATFLQLLVAQLQNQDPTQPVDGTTFVTQLAEFSNVEQNLGERQDLDAISEKYLGTTTPPSTSSTTNAADNSTPASSGTPGVNSTDGSQLF